MDTQGIEKAAIAGVSLGVGDMFMFNTPISEAAKDALNLTLGSYLTDKMLAGYIANLAGKYSDVGTVVVKGTLYSVGNIFFEASPFGNPIAQIVYSMGAVAAAEGVLMKLITPF